MTTTEIPRVDDTDLDRDDLMEAAEELEVEDADSLGDQELFEELGRRLGEIETDAGDGDSAAGDDDVESDPGTKAEASEAPTDSEALGEELGEMTRDEIRDELRSLGLPVSGSKSELVQRLVAARIGADKAGEEATEAAEQAGDTAAQTAEQTGEAAEEAGERGQEAAESVTPDRAAARDADEYRVEDDEREHVSPILDLELGPLALDILGLNIHLNRIHAVLVANPEPNHALLGKLLSGVAKTTDKLGINGAVGKVTDGVEKVVGALPTPDTGSDEEQDDDKDDERDDEGDEPGILGRLRNRITGAGRSAKDAVDSATDAAGNAKDAATDAVTSGGKLRAAKEAKDAFQDSVDAGGSAKDAAMGQG